MKRFAATSTIAVSVILLGITSYELNGQNPGRAAQQDETRVTQPPRGERDLPLIRNFRGLQGGEDAPNGGPRRGARDDEAPHGDHDDHMHHHEHLQGELVELELQQMRSEVLERRAKLFSEPDIVAMIAVDRSLQMMEPDDAVEFLTDLQKDIKSPIVARYVRMKLAEVNAELDDPRAMKAQLRALILMP